MFFVSFVILLLGKRRLAILCMCGPEVLCVCSRPSSLRVGIFITRKIDSHSYASLAMWESEQIGPLPKQRLANVRR